MNNTMLMHYGIKGMKWGVRRNRDVESKPRTAQKQSIPEHEDYKRAHTKKSVKSMSDAELRSRINRIQMEQQYANLSKATISNGRSAVGKIVKTAGTVAGITSTVLTLYSNANKISKIMEEINPGIKKNAAGVAASAIIKGSKIVR